MANNGSPIEKRLWDAADEPRANSKLKRSEYSIPVLGLIFLRYADVKFALAIEEALDQLPDTYDKPLYEKKVDLVYQHVYDSYFGSGRSVYAVAA